MAHPAAESGSAIRLDELVAEVNHPAAVLESSSAAPLTAAEEPAKTTSAEDANAAKALGNEHFSAGRFAPALECYTKAIDAAPLTPEFAPSLAIFYSNRSACHYELGDYDAAAADASKSVDLNPAWIKALLRRARACEKLDNLEDALKDYDAVLALDPKAPGIQRTRDALAEQIKEKNEKMKDEMISKLKELGNTVLGKFGMSLDQVRVCPSQSSRLAAGGGANTNPRCVPSLKWSKMQPLEATA